MIRINLLEETRVAGKAKGGGGGLSMPKVQVAENVPVMILLGGMAAAIAAVAIGGMLFHNQLTTLDASIRQAEEKKKQLEYVLRRDEELRKKKDDLSRKIKIIGDLKERQDLPVQLMDHLSRLLAEHVWFEEVTYAGDGVTIRGRAQTNLALSNQLRNLEDSKYFLEVAMGTVTVEEANGLTRFELTTTFNPSGTQPTARPAATAAGGQPAS